MESNTIDLDSYLTLLGLDEFKSDRPEPNLTTLSKVVEKHATKFLYHNIDLQIKYIRGQPIGKEDLDISYLQKKFVDKKRGGMCYENNFLIEAALVALGFKVQFVSGYPFPYLSEEEPSHVALLVQIESDYYLVDTGCAFNGIRAPLKFNFETTQETLVFGYEKYQIAVEPTHYRVSAVIDEKVVNFFYFMREGSSPKLSDREKVIAEYINFMTSKQEFKGRDWALFIGGATPDGRVGCSFNKKEKTSYKFTQANYLPVKERTEIKDFQAFQAVIMETFDLEIPDELEKICVRPEI